MVGTKVELSDRPNTKGLALVFMLTLFAPWLMGCPGEIGETGVNGAFEADGMKFWNSGCIVKCAAGENSGDMS